MPPQQAYIDQKLGAIIHFNMATFGVDEYGPTNSDVNIFAPTGLDIDQWLDACVSAGMTYAVLTTKHHDGFALWPTTYHVGANAPYSISQTTWYANNGNPDIVGLFVTKCREHGLSPCLYFSIWDATYEARSGTNETTDTAAYITMIKAQLTELLSNYGNIGAIWFDGWGWKKGYTYIQYNPIYLHVKGLQPNCLVIENSHEHPAYTSDIELYETPTADGSIPNGNTRFCEEVNTIRNDSKWFYHANLDQTNTTMRTLANLQAAIAQANNNHATYLLGIMPGTDGHLTAAQVTRLGELGA